LKLTTTIGALLVPAVAVNDGAEGQYVWAVNKDQTVSIRPLKVDRRETDMVVISEGVGPGEKVVTDGQLMLRPGASVVTKEQIKKAREAAKPKHPKATNGTGEAPK